MSFDFAVADEVAAALGRRVARATPLHGGDINEAFAVTLVGDTRDRADGSRYFVKANARAPQGMFAREADGLRWLAAANAIAVPAVVAVTEHALVLTLIEPGARVADFDERLGHGLASLHRAGAKGFGLDHDNFIGTLKQANRPHPDWPTFYRDERLLPLIERAQKHFDTRERALLERLLQRSAELTGDPEPPARLHGDLWGGNLHVTNDGLPCLIDPAVYGGHREIDLAMMRLFGGFGARVFAAYEEAWPLAAGARERLSLYQLYPLLVHVNLFGAAYVPQVVAAARAYV